MVHFVLAAVAAYRVTNLFNTTLLSCRPRVTVTSRSAHKLTRDLQSIDHPCINPIRTTVPIHVRSIDSRNPERSAQASVPLTIVNKILRHRHPWLARQYQLFRGY